MAGALGAKFWRIAGALDRLVYWLGVAAGLLIGIGVCSDAYDHRRLGVFAVFDAINLGLTVFFFVSSLRWLVVVVWRLGVVAVRKWSAR